MSDPFVHQPKLKALSATALFAAAGIMSWAIQVKDISISLPLGIFFATLIINTYFSIAFFSKYIPEDDNNQKIIDSILVVLYLFAALALREPVMFLYALVLLFIAATMKYALLLQVLRHTKLLRKKIIIDLIGAAACAAALGVALLGHASDASWLLAIGFVIANWYLLVKEPMYRL